MALSELLEKIDRIFHAYLAGTAALDEASSDIRHFLNQIAEPERTSIIVDLLRPLALKTDLEKDPLVVAKSVNIATVLVVRIWAAVGRAEQIPAYIFPSISSTDRKWHEFWANVLYELRFSVSEYRSNFKERGLDLIGEHCQLIQRSDAEASLVKAADELRKTIERIQYESNRPKIPQMAKKPQGAIAKANRFKYREWIIVKSLSEGGQGRTFLVRKTDEESLYVLKQLKNPKRLDRFRNEIKAGLALNHRNIVKIVDHHLDDEPYYFVAEYCEGGALRDWKALSQLSLVDRLKLFLGICAGVAFAHRPQSNIVHRDLKPDNIFIRADGSPAIGDFGVCFITEEGERVTLVDEAVGPRNYIAPELEDGRVEDVPLHSDVYSLGKVLYWILTEREFAREKHREAQFDLTKNDPTPENFLIYELFDRMIVSDPAKRFKDANELAFAIEALIERVKAGGHPMDLSAPQRCLYCANGNYKVVVEPLATNVDSRRHSKWFGFDAGPDNALWGIFVCDRCGNVQVFRPDAARDPKVWKKS